jgi:hypothetical protein
MTTTATPDWLVNRIFNEDLDEVSTVHDERDSAYLFNVDLDAAWHLDCDTVFLFEVPARPKEYEPPVCPACYNDVCPCCGLPFLNRAVVTHDPNDEAGACEDCWTAALEKD